MKPSFGDNQDRQRCALVSISNQRRAFSLARPSICPPGSSMILSTYHLRAYHRSNRVLSCFPELPLLTAAFSCQEVISQHSYHDGIVTAAPRPDYGFLWCSHLDLPREKVNDGIKNIIHDGDPWAPREEAQGDSGRIRQLVSACSQVSARPSRHSR
jgi:hypothetical protein